MRNVRLCLLIVLLASIPTFMNSAFFAKMVGAVYDSPTAKPSDVAFAMRWYRHAADLGDAEASRILGDQFFVGRGGITNPRLAAWYWKRAADAGEPEAEAALGDAYCMGIGVPPNSVRALFWWHRAAGQGNQHALDNLNSNKCNTPPEERGPEGI